MSSDTEMIDKLFLELSQFTTAETARERDLKERLRFYARRCALLQDWQNTMRDPERQLVCDILANGALLPDPDRIRYPYFNQP